ncbi:MAG: coenzyme F420-0:L-glutamate ligase, partial [Candidatus Heimdallarchaeaceae archaeon]
MRAITRVELIPLKLPIVAKNDNIGALITSSLQKEKLDINEGDVFVIAHTIISRAEGNEYFLPKL